jgi:hypothetical protein
VLPARGAVVQNSSRDDRSALSPGVGGTPTITIRVRDVRVQLGAVSLWPLAHRDLSQFDHMRGK